MLIRSSLPLLQNAYLFFVVADKETWRQAVAKDCSGIMQ